MNFAQWCSLKNSLPATTKQTVDLLLKESGTRDFQLAESKLISLIYLFLDNKNISDLSLLASLSNLSQLYLRTPLQNICSIPEFWRSVN
jgi:internalin A